MLTLPAELTHRQATACLHQWVQAIKETPEAAVHMDAQALTTFDSSALAVLLACRRAAIQQQRDFTVHHLPPALADLAGLYGVQELLSA